MQNALSIVLVPGNVLHLRGEYALAVLQLCLGRYSLVDAAALPRLHWVEVCEAQLTRRRCRAVHAVEERKGQGGQRGTVLAGRPSGRGF